MTNQNSVGDQISSNFPIVLSNQTIGEVRKLLPKIAKKTDSINYVYVVDSNHKLIGVISVKELFRHRAIKPLKQAMVTDLVVSHPQVSQEKIAHLAVKHNLKSIPVVDNQQKLLGILPNDKILAILYNQYHKSFQHFAGVVPIQKKYQTILQSGVLPNVASRLPWIMVGLVGGIFSAQVINFFEATLSANIILAVFIPLVVYISNAVGSQTQTFLVRDLAFSPKLNIVPYALRQILSGTLIGLVCGCLIGLIISLFWALPYIGLIVGLASFTSISLSTLVAVAIPYALYSLKQEPASGSGPFATILQDLLSIFVYFLIAAILL